MTSRVLYGRIGERGRHVAYQREKEVEREGRADQRADMEENSQATVSLRVERQEPARQPYCI